VKRALGLAVGAALAGAVASASGCLDDLPEPARCPAVANVEGSVDACIDAITQASMNGWMPDPANLCTHEEEFTACYRGPGGCACNTDEEGCRTADDSEACFPSGDCPPRVRDQYPNARCVTLSSDDIGPGVQEPEQCLCGCEFCMSVCDGRGPIWSQLEYWTQATGYADPKGTLTFDVRRHVSTKGRLGVYIRARGTAVGAMEGIGPPIVGVVPADQPLEDGALLGALPSFLDNGFQEVVVPSAQADLYAWENGDAKPGILLMLGGINTLTLMEIDCIVPFVVE
jgi:hypothetical protein